MFTSEEKLRRLRKTDKCLSIWLWHEETLASMIARVLSIKRELDESTKHI